MNLASRTIITACLLAPLTVAHATDRKTYGANTCKASNATSAALLQHAGPLLYNSYNNSSTAYVQCSIVRDNTLNSSGTRYVQMRTSGAAHSCTLQHTGPTGTITGYTGSVSAGSNIKTMYMDVNVSETVGTYAMACTLPPGTYLWGYVVDEW